MSAWTRTLENVIRQALGDAQAAGRDHLSQTELAVRAVQRARPDMTASDALAAVSALSVSSAPSMKKIARAQPPAPTAVANAASIHLICDHPCKLHVSR